MRKPVSSLVGKIGSSDFLVTRNVFLAAINMFLATISWNQLNYQFTSKSTIQPCSHKSALGSILLNFPNQMGPGHFHKISFN